MKDQTQLALIILSILLLSGCMSSADYMQPPPGAIEYGSGPRPVNPDKFKVDPKLYPHYKASTQITPPPSEFCWIPGCGPRQMVAILPTDSWRVTHVFKDYFLIESDSYTQREINYLCNAQPHKFLSPPCSYIDERNYAIYINKEGEITGGWELLPGSKQIFQERDMYLSPSPKRANLWPANFHFVEVDN